MLAARRSLLQAFGSTGALLALVGAGVLRPGRAVAVDFPRGPFEARNVADALRLIGAAGAVEFASTLLSLHTGSIPPTANLHAPDPACPLDYVPLQARHGLALEYALSNSFAFGGSNVSLLARKYRPHASA